MAFIDDVRAARSRRTQAQVDEAALVEQGAVVLYDRLRPVAALAWISDSVMHDACRAFVETSIDKTLLAAA